MSKKSKLTEGSVKKHLFNLTWPMSFGILAVLSTSLVDTYFVGQLGTDQLAALSFTFPVALAINSISIGLGIGTASVISRVVGSEDMKGAKRIATDALILSFLIIVIISTLGFFSIRPLFSLIGAKGVVLDFIETYMEVWFISLPLLVVPMVSGSIIRSLGDSFWPGFQMVLSAIVNLAVTPLLIFGSPFTPAFGFEGAALGTTVAWFCTLLFAIWLVVFRENLIVFKFVNLSEILNSWKKVLVVGLPSATSQVIHPMAIGVVTSFLSKYGATTVAAFGVGTRVESILTIPLFALSAGIPPIAGQNWGSNKIDRIVNTLKAGSAFCIIWGAFASIVIFISGEQITSVFSDDQFIQENSYSYLKVVICSILGYGFVMASSAVFNAIGKPLISLSLSVVRSIILYIPLSFLALKLYDSEIYIYFAIALANIISGVLAYYFGKNKLKVFKEA